MIRSSISIGTPEGLAPALSQEAAPELPSILKLHRDGHVTLDGDTIGYVDHYRCVPKSSFRAVMPGGRERRGFKTARAGVQWLAAGGVG